MLKEKKGITLLALVITIVIIIILATITIRTVFDDNGIVPFAEKAKIETEIASDKEQLQMHYADLYLKNVTEEHKTGVIEEEEYLNFIEEKGIATKEENSKYYANVNKRIYEVKIENGELKIEYVGEGEITEPRIIEVNIVNQVSTSIEIEVKAVRMEGGTYYYSIETSKDMLGEETSSKEARHTFEGLNQGTVYYIKVRCINAEGKETEKIISTLMDSAPDATEENLTYTISWKDGYATVDLETTTNFIIEASTDNIKYEATSKVEGLSHGDIVYARLSNGIYSGKEIQIPVIDNIKPELTIKTSKVTTKSIDIEIIGTDEESGFTEEKPYKIYISSTAEIGKEPIATDITGKYTFNDLDQNTTYYIQVEREDKAGNIAAATITAQTNLIPRAEEAIKRETKWSQDGSIEINLSPATEEAKEFAILYSTDRSDWKSYTDTIKIKNGDIVYVCLTDGRNKGEDYQISVTDNEGPEIEVIGKEVNTNSITVNVKAEDKVSGMPENVLYNYYIKESTEEEYTLVAENEASDTYTYEDLKSQITYNVKVTTKDLVGNEGEGTLEATTGEFTLITGDIEFSNAIWKDKEAKVEVTNNTSYKMEYKIIEAGEEISVEGEWEQVEEKTVIVENLRDEYKIIARLTDGVNSTTGYATCNVDNPAKKSYTNTELANETTRKDFDILAISVNEDKIQVQINQEIENALLYNYYYKTVNDEEYKLISTNTYYNDPATIKNIEPGVTYKIKVLVIDEEGNVTRSENTATTIAASEAELNQIYDDNKTYIDGSVELEVRDGGTVTAGYTVSVPADFKVSETAGENKQSEGVVLKDDEGNEFVWIPVNDAIYDGVTEYPTGTGSSSTYKPMALAQSGYSDYYEGMVYNYNGTLSYRNSSNTGVGKSSYREPSLVTNNANDGYTWNVGDIIGIIYDGAEENYKTTLGFNSPSEFGKYQASSYNNMVTAVDTYGGFYVGRYETTVSSSSGNVVVGSKQNGKVLSENNWYKMNLYQDSTRYASNPYNTKTSVATSMIWGSQWDTMLNYILTGNDKGKVTTKVGNRINSVHNSGEDSTDKINNIYDLGANVYEWTMEANATNYRIYRGGSYDTTNSSTASTRGNIVPTDQGPAFGSRIGMYVKSTNDITGPSVSISKIEATSNSITVEVSARDAESGIAGYKYYIGTEKGTYDLAEESNTNKYTYEGLKQNTTYYIKVEAIDGAGNVGTSEEKGQKTSTFEANAKESIKRVQKYGPDGSGIIQLELDEKYADTGYYIEYQVADNAETEVSPEGSWTKGDTINNLSNGQKIYARINDGINGSSDYYEEVVDGLEEYAYIDASGKTYTDEEAMGTPGKTTYDTTISYTDEQGKTAAIPAGFKVGTTDSVKNIDNGLVVQDAKGNQFVWVPVETVVETDKSTTSSEKAMARLQSGYGTDGAKKYYEGILYNFSGTTSTKRNGSNAIGTSSTREPTLITGGADYTWNVPKEKLKGNAYDILEQYYKYMSFETTSGVDAFESYTEMGQYMNEEYTNMVQSVEKYGGFYVGRFETSYEGNTNNQNAVVQCKIAQNPINDRNWYYDYYYQDSNINPKNPYYNSKNVTSSMIWGSQWDAIMNWMLTDDATKSFITQVTGNHEDKVAKTGTYTDDLAKNIFDLSSNVSEWTQEGEGTPYRTQRGSSAIITSDKYITTASGRANWHRAPNVGTIYSNTTGGGDTTKSYLGSRMSLYIKNEEDTTAPTLKIDSTSAGTNNIEVKVTANDEESGISKYRYSISLKNFQDSGFNEEIDILKTEETHGNSYTYSDLNDNQTYYIRIEAINGVGKVAVAYAGPLQTEFLEVEEGAIVREKVYGKNGEGRAYFTISEDTDFVEEGYYLEYQVGKSGAAYNPDGEWTKGDTVENLSVGDVIYTRLYDGVNIAEYYMTTNISELETFSDVYQTTTKYEDYDTVPVEGGGSEQKLVGTAYIPAGFKVATSDITKKIANGLVIEDEKGNQFVWIPVKDVVYDEKTAISNTYKPMFKYQNGYSESTEKQYFERIYYSFSGVTSTGSTNYGMGQESYREPSLVTNSTANYSWVYTAGNNYDATNYNQLAELGIDSPTKMGTYLNDKYTDMVESIKKYGGYYVGRHETSLFTEEGENSTSGTVVKSVTDETPMASVNWYKMYLVENSDYENNPYHTSSSVTCQMMTGGQWDAMLNYILEGTDKEKVTAVTGNHTGTRAVTGQFGNDIMNNIFDLVSDVREWTTETYGTTIRTTRGGSYYADDVGLASDRNDGSPTSTFENLGSRLSLYLK